jgi:hypothetical protein
MRLPAVIVALAIATVAALAAPLAASAATNCSTSTRAHSTSTRSGTVWVRACGGTHNYGQFGVDTRTIHGLQTEFMRVTVSVFSSSGTLLASKTCSTGATSNLFWYEMCAPSFKGVAGRRYYTRSVLTYDVKDDGKGSFTLSATSPVTTA